LVGAVAGFEAAGDLGLLVLHALAEGVEHLDALGVLVVDNGGDIEVGGSSVAAEANLTKHARGVLRTLIIGIEIAYPLVGEGLVGSLQGSESESFDALEARVGSEDNVLSNIGLVDELDEVFGGCHGCERGGCEKNGVDELHLDGCSLLLLVKDCFDEGSNPSSWSTVLVALCKVLDRKLCRNCRSRQDLCRSCSEVVETSVLSQTGELAWWFP